MKHKKILAVVAIIALGSVVATALAADELEETITHRTVQGTEEMTFEETEKENALDTVKDGYGWRDTTDDIENEGTGNRLFIGQTEYQVRYESVEESYYDGEPVVSESGMTVSVEATDKHGVWWTIVISKDGEQLQFCELEGEFFTAILELEWIDDNRVMLVGHINPSTNQCIVYDVAANSYFYCYGQEFTWDSEAERIVYVQTSPHFSEEKEPVSIVDSEGNVYYTAPDLETHIRDIEVYRDALAFLREDDNYQIVVLDMTTGNLLRQQTVSAANVNITLSEKELADD